MTVIKWGSFTVFLLCMFALFHTGPDMILWALAMLMLATVVWSSGWFYGLVEDDPDPDARTGLDDLERFGSERWRDTPWDERGDVWSREGGAR